MVVRRKIATVRCGECGSSASDEDIFCSFCGKMLISFVKISSAIFIISVLAAVVLFRLGASPWPMYLLITLGILHLYAVIYSRGAALNSVTLTFAIITLLWGIWIFVGWRVQFEGSASGLRTTWERIQHAALGQLPGIALFIWIVGIAWALWLGQKKSLGPIRIASSYFLGMGAFIFGLWGVWALLIQSNRVPANALQFVLIMSLVIPVFLLIVLLWREKPPGPAGQALAISLFPIMAYFLVFELFLRLAEFGLGRFLPRILGMSPLQSSDIAWLNTVLQWRGLVLSLMVAGVIVSLAALSSAEALVEFRATQQPTPRQSGRRGTTSPLDDLAEGIGNFAASMGHVISNTAAFVGIATIRFAYNVRDAVLKALPYLRKLVKYVFAPVAAFSVLSFLIIIVLSRFFAYEQGLLTSDPKALWGAALIVLVLVLVLCAASFGFAPARSAFEVFPVTKAAIFIAISLYFILSGASLAFLLVWGGFLSLKVDFIGVRPGPIYWLNTIVVVTVAIALAFTVRPVNLQTWLNGRIPGYATWRPRIQTSLVIVPCLVGVAMGIGVVLQSILLGFK